MWGRGGGKIVLTVKKSKTGGFHKTGGVRNYPSPPLKVVENVSFMVQLGHFSDGEMDRRIK